MMHRINEFTKYLLKSHHCEEVRVVSAQEHCGGLLLVVVMTKSYKVLGGYSVEETRAVFFSDEGKSGFDMILGSQNLKPVVYTNADGNTYSRDQLRELWLEASREHHSGWGETVRRVMQRTGLTTAQVTAACGEPK